MTTIIIILLSAAVMLMVILIAALIWRIFRQSDDIKQKNDVIVREVRRNQWLIHRGGKSGRADEGKINMLTN